MPSMVSQPKIFPMKSFSFLKSSIHDLRLISTIKWFCASKLETQYFRWTIEKSITTWKIFFSPKSQTLKLNHDISWNADKSCYKMQIINSSYRFGLLSKLFRKWQYFLLSRCFLRRCSSTLCILYYPPTFHHNS